MNTNEKIQSEIQNHFDQETKLKKQILEINQTINRLQQDNKLILNELNQKDDENVRSKMQHNKENITKSTVSLEHLNQDYFGIFSKRTSLLSVFFLIIISLNS